MKYHGPVRFIFNGKKELCSKYTGRARLYLQQAITRMGPDKAAWNRTEPDGTTIRISSFSSGYNVVITCKGEEEYVSCASGFFLEPKSDEAPLGFRPDKSPIEADDGFFPGITVKDGEVVQDNVEFKGLGTTYTLDWTAPWFEGYLVWPATPLNWGTDENSIDWEAFHRYICAPFNGRLYYCNESHSGSPGGLALGYAVRVLGKTEYLYCASTESSATIRIHRRIWTEEPYSNDDELSPTNPLGWEWIGDVSVLNDFGYPADCWNSGAYFNTDGDKFVITMNRGNQTIPGGYIEVSIGSTGIITTDTSGLLEYDFRNGTYQVVNTYDPVEYPDTGPWNGVYFNHYGTLELPDCVWSDPSSLFYAGGYAAWGSFRSGVGWSWTNDATHIQGGYWDYDPVIVGADYDYKTGQLKKITQKLMNTAASYNKGRATAGGGYSNSAKLIDCKEGCGAIWEITGTYNGNWKSWAENYKNHFVNHEYDGDPGYSYRLIVDGNKAGSGISGGEWWITGIKRFHEYRWVCPNDPYNTINYDSGKVNIYEPGYIQFDESNLLYIDLRHGTYIRVLGYYRTDDGGLSYTSNWKLDINGDIQEFFDISPNTVTSDDSVPGFLGSLFPGDGDIRTRYWDYNLVPYLRDNLAWWNLGDTYTNKNGELISLIPTYSIEDLYWSDAVYPDTSKMRLYYSPYGFDTLERLGYSGTNLTVSRLRLV